MTYTPTAYVNGSVPALSATNLNHAENGIADVDARVTDLEEGHVLRASGSYFVTAGGGPSTGTQTNQELRVYPWYLPNSVTLTRIGAEVTIVGEAGSLFRLGIYADDGTGYPGSRMIDAGTIAGDSATTQELTISLALTRGLYWIGGATQAAATTQPTMRVVSSSNFAHLIRRSTIPSAGATYNGFTLSGISGALPATYSAGAGQVNNIARIIVKT